MKNKIIIKRIIIVVIVIASITVLYIVPVLAQGVSLRYWVKLGCPNPIKVLEYRIDEYPGHSLECMRYPDRLIEDTKGENPLIYTEIGSGIDSNGYHLHVGDSREHIMDEFFYLDPDGNGTRYELGCFYCETSCFLIFEFEYDEEDKVDKMTILKTP